MPMQKENAKIVVFPSSHPVYQSLMKVFSSISKIGTFELLTAQHGYKRPIPVLSSPTNIVYYTKQDFDKKNLHILLCPLLTLGTWEALIERVPFIGISEYLGNRGYKDILARAVLFNFKNIPFIAHTKRTKKFLESCGFKSVFLIPPAEKKRQGSNERRHILFVGRLVGSKNVFVLLKIAKHFQDEKFVIIGNGPLLDSVCEEAKKLQNVEVIPSLENREELFEYYSQAKVLIHPAIKDPVGFVVIEALSTQTPTLVSSGVGASDYLPSNWVSNPNDEADWVLKIQHILDNQKESIKKAERVFTEEHLDLSDPFFEKSAEKIYQFICFRWPHFCGKKE